MSDDLFRREFLGRPVTPKIEELHPLPWTVKAHQERGPYETRGVVFVILDARERFVAECEKESVARTIVEAIRTSVAMRRSSPAGGERS